MICDTIKIKIPDVKGVVTRTDGRILYTKADPSTGKVSHPIIGRIVKNEDGNSTDKMYPTENFKDYFPDLWKKHIQGDLSCSIPSTIKIGTSLVVRQIMDSLGINDILSSTFGAREVDKITDYVIFMFSAKDNVTDNYQDEMRDHLFFSSRLYDDSTYSRFFTADGNEERVEKFRKLWLEKYIARWQKKGEDNKMIPVDTYIVLDGTNIAFESKESELAELGKAKKEKGKPQLNIFLVIDERGMPISFRTYRGKRTDFKLLKPEIDQFATSEFQCLGLILDRGFCGHENVENIDKSGYDWIMMLTDSSWGLDSLKDTEGGILRFRFDRMVDGTHLYGETRKTRIFKNDEKEHYIHLFYDWKNGGNSTDCFIDKIRKQMAENAKAKEHGEKPIMAKGLKEYFTDDGNPDVSAIQRSMDRRGLYGIATSSEMTTSKAHEIYAKRDVVEKCFAYGKTTLNQDRVRVHSDGAAMTKMMMQFIVSIVNAYLKLVVDELNETNEKFDLSFSTVKDELEKMEITSQTTGNFIYDLYPLEKVDMVLRKIGLKKSVIDKRVENYSQKIQARRSKKSKEN